MENNDPLSEYKSVLNTLIRNSQEAFEKQLVYISGGSLGGSFLVLEKFIDSFTEVNNIWLLIGGWLGMGLSLMLNLYSHRFAERVYSRTVCDIEDEKYNSEKANRRAVRVGWMNQVCFYLLSVGIVLFSIFIITNINYMNKKNTPKPVETTRAAQVAKEKMAAQAPRAPQAGVVSPKGNSGSQTGTTSQDNSKQTGSGQ